MRLFRILVAAALLVFSALFALLPAIVCASALDQFKSYVANTKSASGDFTQRQVKMIDGSVKISNPSIGTFVFASPGKFIWTYHKPYQQIIKADGETLYLYDKDLNQVTTRKLGNALASSPAAILFGSNGLEKSFTLKEVGTKNGLEWLEATPQTRDTSFEKIGIGMRNGLPEAMELRDSFGQVSLLTFKNFEINSKANSEKYAQEFREGNPIRTSQLQQQPQQDMQQFADAIGLFGQQMQNSGQQMLFGQQMQNSGQQMLNSVTSQPKPQVFTPPGDNQVRCFQSGQITSCRY